MTQYLALDWESHRLSGICANVDGGQILSQSCFQLDWPANLAEDDDGTQTGRWLREELDRLGIAVSQVLVCLPREDSVVRQLELPAVPDKELPDIVRLQAATNLTSLDQFLLDFLPLPTLPEADGRDVLMATIPIELANRIRTATAAAGLELKSIGLSPVATAELVARAEAGRGDDPRQSSLFVALHGERVEISMMRQQCLIFSHSAQLSGTDAADYSRLLLAEINRARSYLEKCLTKS